ncbi:MAG: tRNA pseudouridine synthase A [Gemmatimonadaceae bacterium]|nr:tRNA pseudouridine synthase A [Gemmatimonadaceae bacterium]
MWKRTSSRVNRFRDDAICLYEPPLLAIFRPMTARNVQLVLHYDGSAFSGWQIQPRQRTVQGEVERVLADLCGQRVVAQGAGRTDAGVHARGQAVGVKVASTWKPAILRRAINAKLPQEVWVAAAHEMRPEFHARFSATSRRYAYHVGTDEDSFSPFRRKTEWARCQPLDVDLLQRAARTILGEHSFLAFAVRGTAPPTDHHRCNVVRSEWESRSNGFTYHVEANRFLHHMVRFLVGTMLEIAAGKRPLSSMDELLDAPSNVDVAPPAPAHALFLEAVTYPADLYLAPQ